MTSRLTSIACRAAGAIVFALSLSPAVRATVVVPAELPELTADATIVVRGTVIATEARWLEGRRGIETIVTLAASDYVKGSLGRSLTFRVPGGQMGPYRSFMVGAPVFHDGEDVILFLKASGAALPHIVGFNQGVYRVHADDGGNPVVEVREGREGLRMFAAAGGNSNATVTRPPHAHEPVSVFLTRVRALASAGPVR